MKIGVIGDDFTGSSDIANTLARAGARTLQYVGMPDGAAGRRTIEAAVIALKTRSIAAGRGGRAVAARPAAGWWRTGAEQIVFKYCSTFDSTPQGNIGPVAEALLDELGAPLALVCPAFPANGRTVYQGHLFVGDRLLNESGMENHPLTPMTDPDIRRWLARQTQAEVGHLPLAALRAGSARRRWRPCRPTASGCSSPTRSTTPTCFGSARCARRHRLVTGGSGIALGLPANFGIAPAGAAGLCRASRARRIVLSGSCSAATRGRSPLSLGAPGAAARRPSDALAPEAAVGASARLPRRVPRCGAAGLSRPPTPRRWRAAQARYRPRAAGRGATSGSFAELDRGCRRARLPRIVVAGGETSGAVAAALGSVALEIGPEIDPGVPALATWRAAAGAGAEVGQFRRRRLLRARRAAMLDGPA